MAKSPCMCGTVGGICNYLEITPKEFFDINTVNPTKVSELIEATKGLSSDQLSNLISLARGLILLFNKTLQKLKSMWYNVYGDETMSYTFTAHDLETIREARKKNKDKR
ncbi:MAG: hypothetical protein IJH07_09165, partial [Ruminococcus sp.]|nr:hypothetical protein [Ruminococcus sp.]